MQGGGQDSATLIIGSLIDGRYKVQSLIGRGGMGAVYKAEHVGINKLVALKLLDGDFSGDSTVAMRFSQEAKAAGSLSHENLVGVSDFGFTSSGVPFLVMDYLKGHGLENLLEQEGHLPQLRALDIFIQIARGLAHAHARGVVHRDLKPGNIILVDDAGGREQAKVVDFGIARLATKIEQALTRDGEIFGSPPYMSPEQCTGLAVDSRSDIYSLGCVMYKTLTGKYALYGASAVQTLFKHAEEQAKPFKDVCPDIDISPQLEAIVFRCLAKIPDQRYQTMGALEEDLVLVRKKLGPSDPEGKAPNTFPLHPSISAGALLILALAVWAGFHYLDPAQAPSKASSAAIIPSKSAASLSVVSGDRRGPELQWSDLDMQAQEALDKGDYDRARLLYGKSYELAKSIGPQFQLSSAEGLIDLDEITGKKDAALATEIGKLGHETMDCQPVLSALSGANSKQTVAAAMRQSRGISSLLLKSGRYSESIKLQKAAIEAGRHWLSPDDPEIARCLLTLASSYGTVVYAKASSPEIDYRLQALSIANKNSINELKEECLSSIGIYYNIHQQHRLAIPYLLQAQEIDNAIFGAASMQAALCSLELTGAYGATGQGPLENAAAHETMSVIMAIKPDMFDANCFYIKGLADHRLNKQNDAIRDFTRALHEYERDVAKNYPQIAVTCQHLVENLPCGSRPREALTRRCMAILRRIGSMTEADQCSFYYNLAYGYLFNHDVAKEREAINHALPLIPKLIHSTDGKKFINLALCLATLDEQQGRMKEAEKNALLYKSWVEEAFGSGTRNFYYANALSAIAGIYAETGRVPEGRRLMEETIHILKNYQPERNERSMCQELGTRTMAQLEKFAVKKNTEKESGQAR